MRCNGAGGMDHGRCPRPSSQRGTAGGARPPGDAPVGRAERVGLRGGVCLPAATADPRGSSSIPEPSARVGESLETSYLDPRESELRDGGPSPFDNPPPNTRLLSLDRERERLPRLSRRPPAFLAILALARRWRADGTPRGADADRPPTPGAERRRARRNESNAEDAPGPAGRPPLLPSSSGAVFAESERRPAPRRSMATATGASLLSRVVPRREMRKLKRGLTWPGCFCFLLVSTGDACVETQVPNCRKKRSKQPQRVFFCQLSAKRRKNEGSLLAKNRGVETTPAKKLKGETALAPRKCHFSCLSLIICHPTINHISFTLVSFS